MSSPAKQVIILGEALLVSELAGVCHAHGYNIVCSNAEEKSSLPPYCKHRTTLPKQVSAAFELTNINPALKRKNLLLLEKALTPQAFIFSSSITVTSSEQASWLNHPERLLGISALPTLLSNTLLELTSSPAVSSPTIKKAKDFLISIGKKISFVQDRIGMVLPRIICMIINEAYFACMEDVATPSDIDVAMRLGVNYPEGPIKWSQQISLRQVVAVLDSLHNDLHEERYRIAPLLRQMALQIR